MRLKLWIDWLKCTAKILLKQRLDFPFQNKIESMDTDYLKSKAKNLLNQRLVFPFENKIKTMDSLAKMHGQNIVETTVRFSA